LKLDCLLKEEGQIEKMKENALKLGKPLAAKSIVEEIQRRFFD
jgi:UDP-N-acetylglucosamine:LPS N-acetylglucosamine transferase